MYSETKARIEAATRIHYVLMPMADDAEGYATLYHAFLYLIQTLPEYPGCQCDRYWITASTLVPEPARMEPPDNDDGFYPAADEIGS